MKRISFILIAIALMITACKTSQEVNKSSARKTDRTESIGHLKMRFIEYEIDDSTAVNSEVAEMMIEMIKPSLETDLVYNSTKSADLVIEDGKYVRMSLYDRTTKAYYQFKTKDTVQYYTKMQIDEMMSEVKTPEDELSEMFRIGSEEVDILGFKCTQVTMMQPPEFTEVYSVVYATDEIPHVSEAMGSMSEYVNGAPIKTTLYVNGLKITIGATESSINDSLKKFLHVDESQYQELTAEEFESINY